MWSGIDIDTDPPYSNLNFYLHIKEAGGKDYNSFVSIRPGTYDFCQFKKFQPFLEIIGYF
jgi:hypothetical protein